MENNLGKKIQYLIVDTSAFINNASLQDIGQNIITVPEVINEIKSKRQLRRLVVLPYDLQVKEAYTENVKFVNEFSKKTGDYASLSATDINVIALTYQLEKEKNGTDHLNSAPLHKTTIEPISKIPEELKNIVGFHLPKSGIHVQKLFSDNGQNDKLLNYDSAEDEEFDDAKEELESDESEGENCCVNEIVKKCNISSNKRDDLENSTHISENDINPIEENHKDEDDDNDWITPENVHFAKTKLSNELIENFENVSVACLTTDYAMQNVLKQIGLHVVSLDGKLIKQLRTYILRCYGCFKTTSIMSKVFCPNCGNKTLKKVSVSVNSDGTQQLHINFKKPLTARGKRYSLPRPKGGKHSNNPILCEDQPMPQQKPSRLSQTKNNPLNDDYIAGYSPFVMRDITSKSAMLGIKPYVEIKHWARKNSNTYMKKKK